MCTLKGCYIMMSHCAVSLPMACKTVLTLTSIYNNTHLSPTLAAGQLSALVSYTDVRCPVGKQVV